MKWKDSDDQTKIGEKTAKDYMDEEDNPHWTAADGTGLLGNLINRLRKLIPVLLGVALFMVVFGGMKVLFSSGGAGGTGSENRLKILEDRIRYLEEKYEKFDSVDNKVTRIWEQANNFENFKERFDRTEASMTLRMDHLATSIDSIQKRLVTAKSHSKSTRPVQSTRESVSQKDTATSASVQYHTVAPKDTLYSISKKYGIKLDNLLEMNHMEKNVVIKPGQKLIVKK
ncbi:MAG: LysM domain-containing protein [Desulfobacteraceae bacterium]|jgi:hypothetical protein